MANTMTLIASSTVGAGGAAGFTFASIPGTYTDLLLKTSIRKSDATTLSSSYLKFNSSSSSYSVKRVFGNGSSVSSDTNPTGTSALYIGSTNSATSTSNTFSNMDIYIPNYAGSTNKSVSVDIVQEDNASAGYQFLIAGLWSNTAAITQIDITGDANCVQYSTAYLYGIKNS
jgi:hypothetical protein